MLITMSTERPALNRTRSVGSIVILVLLAILLVIALLPIVQTGFGGEPWRQQRCGKNMSQLMGACVAYAQEYETEWPWARFKASVGQPIATDAHSARLATVRNLEVLAQVESLPNSLFHCPFSTLPGPSTKPDPWNDDLGLWGAGPANSVSYAFDWAAPGDPGADRVIFADRDLAHHQGHALVCFGDSHVKSFKTVPRSQHDGGYMLTEGSDGRSIGFLVISSASMGRSDDPMPDDFYQADPVRSDAELTPCGSKMKAWVK